jgi:hypothetical protein
MDSFKDVEINGVRYQVGRMTARTGSWILAQIFTKIMPATVEGNLGFDLPGGRSEMSEEEFHNLQDHCLAVCSRYEELPPGSGRETAMPIMASPGVFAVKELEYDLVAVLGLTIHALVFNVACFFDGDALTSILESFRGLSLFKAST